MRCTWCKRKIGRGGVQQCSMAPHPGGDKCEVIVETVRGPFTPPTKAARNLAPSSRKQFVRRRR